MCLFSDSLAAQMTSKYVRTKMTHKLIRQVCHWTEVRQHGNYLFYIVKKPKNCPLIQQVRSIRTNQTACQNNLTYYLCIDESINLSFEFFKSLPISQPPENCRYSKFYIFEITIIGWGNLCKMDRRYCMLAQILTKRILIIVIIHIYINSS